jgi:hypothetical protein
MPARFLFAVSRTFEAKGIVCIEPLVPLASCDDLKKGDILELRKPDGSVIETTLFGLEWPIPSRGALIMTLPPPIKKNDVPSGTQIWKVRSYNI